MQEQPREKPKMEKPAKPAPSPKTPPVFTPFQAPPPPVSAERSGRGCATFWIADRWLTV